MQKECFLVVRERNIDGCGGFADVLLRLQEPLEAEKRGALQAELEYLKHTLDCPDTDAVVEEAARKVLGDDVEWLDYDLVEY